MWRSLKSVKKDKDDSGNSEKLSYTLFLNPDNKKYLQVYKIFYDEEITEVINGLIDELRHRKPIEVKYRTIK